MTTSIVHRIGNAAAICGMLPAYLAFNLLKRVMPLPRLVQWAWHDPVSRSSKSTERQVVGRVLRLSTLLGRADKDCLQRSLLLYRVLSRRGDDPVLVSGFRRENGTLKGHTWIVAKGRPIAEAEHDLAAFAPALRFGPGGALLPE